MYMILFMPSKYVCFVTGPSFLCNTCGRGFQSRQELTDHVKIKHGAPKFQCTACFKGFSTKTHYTSHMQNHLNVRNSAVYHKTNYSFDLIYMYNLIVKVRVYRYIFFKLTMNSYKTHWIINNIFICFRKRCIHVTSVAQALYIRRIWWTI